MHDIEFYIDIKNDGDEEKNKYFNNDHILLFLLYDTLMIRVKRPPVIFSITFVIFTP
jgi:hypothetical protein